MKSKSDLLRPRYWIVIVLVIGWAVTVLSLFFPDAGRIMRYIGLAYLLFGVFLGVPRFFWKRKTEFWQAVAVGVGFVVLVFGLEIQGIMAENPALGLSEVFLMAFRNGYLPVSSLVLGFIVPFGVADSKRTEILIIAGIGTLFMYFSLTATGQNGAEGGVAGPGLSRMLLTITTFLTVAVGVPLFYFGRSLRSDTEPPAKAIVEGDKGEGVSEGEDER
ncbi:MAG: hypothetical protein ABEK59_07830 [Halobacteria archaeon]